MREGVSISHHPTYTNIVARLGSVVCEMLTGNEILLGKFGKISCHAVSITSGHF